MPRSNNQNCTLKNITIVLVRPSIPGNIGAVARSMANFGFSKLLLVEPKCKIDEEARNRAKHAQKILGDIKIMKSLKDICKTQDLFIATTGVLGTDYNIPRSPLLPEEVAKKLSGVKGKIALVFGPEDTGLSNEELEVCDFTVNIPTSKTYPVMNLSHAVTVLLYELSKPQHSRVVSDSYPLVSGKEKQILEHQMSEVIKSVSYRTPFEMRTQTLVWKRILGKAAPTKREAYAMIGLLKKISCRDKKK
ncbi:MAG: RNA methyltransferase [Candidatus Nanoarchaeia archaeon]